MVLDSLTRDQVLASSETTAQQQYIAVNGSKYKTAIKKPQIMLRTAPNFSNIRNRVPAHISRHQTFDIIARFVGIDNNKYFDKTFHFLNHYMSAKVITSVGIIFEICLSQMMNCSLYSQCQVICPGGLDPLMTS